jgi:hypothetical protein
MRKKLVNILNDIEKKYPVNQWTYNGIYVWPIIKLQIYFYYLHNFIEKGVSSKSQQKSKAKRINEIFVSLIQVIRLLVKPKVKGKWIVGTESENYKTIWNNTKINKFYHPLETPINQEGFQLLYLNWSSTSKNNKSSSPKGILFMNQYYPFFRFWNKLKSFFKKPKVFFPEYKSIIEEIESEMPFKLQFSKGNEKKYLCHNIERVFSYSTSIKLVLQKYRPELILELCYYNLANLSLNILANESNIPVIEIQHGSLGPSHLGYTGWSNFPKNGYNLFPNKIWCWDTLSYDHINTWASKNSNIELIIGGNTWVTYIKNSKLKDLDRFFEKKTIILYTMQRNYIEDYIYETIKLSSEKYLWMLRAHPRHLESIEEIKRKAAQYKIENKIELDKAQKMPLPAILINSYLHLSEFSGSIIEAATIGTHSIILNQDGVDSYSSYIDEGKATAFLSKNPEKLFHFINNFVSDTSIKDKKLINYNNIIKNIIKTSSSVS